MISPIGLFDSGIGGLTVLRSLVERFPSQDFVYLGDTARLPYGTKSSQTVQKYAEQTISFLQSKNVEAIVSACHSASSAILEHDIKADVPLFNVIEPACTSAVAATQNKNIGLLATQATVNGGFYLKQIKKLDPNCHVFQMAAPLLVPLVETGWVDDPLTNLVVLRYSQELKKHGVDTVILGCTHYPVLSKVIQRSFGNEVRLIDPSSAVAKKLADSNMAKIEGSGKVELYLTDSSEHFLANARKILGSATPLSFQHIDLK